jgi:hypothetical protein
VPSVSYFVLFCSSNIFFINHVLKFRYQPGRIKVQLCKIKFKMSHHRIGCVCVCLCALVSPSVCPSIWSGTDCWLDLVRELGEYQEVVDVCICGIKCTEYPVHSQSYRPCSPAAVLGEGTVCGDACGDTDCGSICILGSGHILELMYSNSRVRLD